MNRPRPNQEWIKGLIGGMIGSLIIFGLIIYLISVNRGAIFNYFGARYLTELKQSNNNLKETGPALLTDESLITGAVEKASPAVVSIVITKEVPVIERYYENFDPFGGFFNFPIPQERQKGTKKREVGGGSGFLIATDGLIVTNRHVVDDAAASYSALTNDGKKHEVEIIAKDPVLDIAVLRIKGGPFAALTLGDSDKIKVGQTAIAIGNALGEFKNTVSVGVISGLFRSIVAADNFGQAEALDEVIQTDAAINPGNSGGPLLDLQGRVIGVNVAIAQGSENIGFALPVNLIKSVIESVKKYNKIIRPYLGVRYVKITPLLKEKNKLTVDYGVLIARGATTEDLAVIPGSPADKAGLVENDIILEIDGTKLDDKKNLSTLIRQKQIGDAVTLKILHRGETKTVTAKLEAAKE